jgi:aspartyl-tRNA(Asn)/glutamyl-tRNA(Gln) amidotransferase subunit C
MSITKSQVLSTAKLARLRITEDKVDTYITELNKILDVINKLQAVNTTGLEPVVNVNEFPLPLRKDEVTDGNLSDDIFANAPQELYRHFAVPKVIE